MFATASFLLLYQYFELRKVNDSISGLVFLGKLIPDNIKLSEVEGLKTGHTVYVMKRPQSGGLSGGTVNEQKLNKCRSAFIKIKGSRMLRLKVETLLVSCN